MNYDLILMKALKPGLNLLDTILCLVATNMMAC